MDKIFLKSRAKINLTLNVTEKRQDGYHDIESLFQKINLYDEIFIEKLQEDKFVLDTNFNEIKVEENIIYKAYMEMKKLYDINGVKVKLNKNIPSQAGMAGGSTNCSTFLMGINKLFNLKLELEELAQIGSRLGADVVPCMYNGIVKANGIGDKITKVENNLVKFYLIIVKPRFSCNTKTMFEKIDKNNISQQINTDNMINAIKNNNINEVSNNLYNIFEEVLDQKNELEAIKEILKTNGARGTLLSGSGSAIYGIFDKKNKAKLAYYNLKKITDIEFDIYYSLPYNK